ncbi:alpha/beta hydrolase [Pseudomonas sp. CFBP 8758]|uniref:Alpha/beta hydrolase n=1 Tax=Pseudomonas baltica TaxID=2762576 RepID=A0A7X1G6R3_9PSED|nr:MULTISPECIES: alpha/beta hydrolase [Pseudomonas]MBC2679482.1 alpha/beta hydrolase [Pseudomonas baltica]MBD8594235.1 alpha/beta hydrolase [Pseudomonas sp. CFBP 8758]
MPIAFHPDTLRNSLPPLGTRQPLSAEAQAYQRFYQLDLPVQSWLGRFSAAGFDLVAQVWLPERPVATLFVMHGFYDHMGLYRHAVQWALARGFAVISCDLPGHGLSSGERASIHSFADYQATLDGLFAEARTLQLPQPWHLLGQSTGGAIIVDHLLHQGAQSAAQGQVLLMAPLVRPSAWGLSKLSYRVLKPFVNGIARRFSANTNDPDFMPFLQADPLQPVRLPTAWVGALVQWVQHIEAAPRSPRTVVVVQGEDDDTVDWRHNLKVLRAKFAEVRVLQVAGARHHLVNELPAIRAKCFDFFEQNL